MQLLASKEKKRGRGTTQTCKEYTIRDRRLWKGAGKLEIQVNNAH